MSMSDETTTAELRADAERAVLRAIESRADHTHDPADILALAQALNALLPHASVQHAEALTALRAARHQLASLHGVPYETRADGTMVRIDNAPTLALVNGVLDAHKS